MPYGSVDNPVDEEGHFTSWLLFEPYAPGAIGRRGMTDTVSIAGDRILSLIERIEYIDDEIKALTEAKKEVFAEGKGEGYDVKILKEILKLRKKDKDERDEQDSLMDIYLHAIETAEAQQAKAA